MDPKIRHKEKDETGDKANDDVFKSSNDHQDIEKYNSESKLELNVLKRQEGEKEEESPPKDVDGAEDEYNNHTILAAKDSSRQLDENQEKNDNKEDKAELVTPPHIAVDTRPILSTRLLGSKYMYCLIVVQLLLYFGSIGIVASSNLLKLANLDPNDYFNQNDIET